VKRLRLRLVLGGALAASALAGCASAPSILSGDAGWFSKPVDLLRTPDWGTPARAGLTMRPVGPDDLLGPDGACASVSSSALAATDNAPGTPADSATPAAGGIGLDMSECEVVRRAGTPERFDVGNEGGERSVVLTYLRGARPGIYRFVAGRLVSIERAPEAPAQPKPQRPVKRRAS
jgi:hypothetical protein